jgi:type I restriction-modification system DNA methylase subunit
MKEQYKKIIELLEFTHGKYHSTYIFKDFVVLYAIAIKNIYDYNQEDENMYLQIINKYEKGEREMFVKLGVELIKILEMQNEITDVLGEIYEVIGASSKNFDQFFTQMHIANMNSDIILGKIDNTNEEHIIVRDDACGSGVLLLSVANSMLKQNIDYKQKLIVEGKDIDLICFCMTYIQLSLYAIPGRVILGNSLLNESKKVFYTPQYITNKWQEEKKERG